MANKNQVLDYFSVHRDSTSTEIGDALDCDGAYVRATLRRAGLVLVGSRQRHNGIKALGRAARRAGLTLSDIEKIAAEKGLGA